LYQFPWCDQEGVAGIGIRSGRASFVAENTVGWEGVGGEITFSLASIGDAAGSDGILAELNEHALGEGFIDCPKLTGFDRLLGGLPLLV